MQELTGKKKFFFLVIILLLFTTYNFKNNLIIPFFLIKEINILNSKNTEEHLKENILNKLFGVSLLNLKKNEISAIFENSKWVKSFKFKKIYPSKLDILIEEYNPIALFKKNNSFYFINENFETVPKKINITNNEFVIFSGKFSKKRVKILFNHIQGNTIFDKVYKVELRPIGRNNLLLKNGTVIKLGDYDIPTQLKIINNILDQNQFTKLIDLRVKGRAVIK